MSRTIRMIGVDLDGTLLNSEKQLTAYTVLPESCYSYIGMIGG